VRFWNTDGTFRAKTPPRPERFIYPAGMTVVEVGKVADRSNPVLIAHGVAVVWSQRPVRKEPGTKPDVWNGLQQPRGPMDLYSTRTGQFIRRLDRQGWSLSDFQLAASGSYVIYHESKDQVVEVVVVSAEDGRELARLVHTGGEGLLKYKVSPSGNWVLTLRGMQVRLWRSQDWKLVENDQYRQLVTALGRTWYPYLSFITDEVVNLGYDADWSSHYGVLHLSRSGLRVPGAALGAGQPQSNPVVSELGGMLIRCGRVLTDANTFQRLNPPRGRKYHPDLAKIGPDGRFFENLDTVTEKELPYSFQGRHFPGQGRVGIRTYGEGTEDAPRYYDDAELRILPDPKRLDIPPAMLELWAQVVVGGELTSDGRFQPWDQPTWVAKQKELAAMKPPYPDFPFPGWAATEPNLWYRIRANMQKPNSHEYTRLTDEWRRRSGRVRPKPEADTWRTPRPVAEPAPPPRPVN
jgi:hypothetical protein